LNDHPIEGGADEWERAVADAERVLVYRMTVLASWLADGAESRGALATVAPLAA
jgi:hypothetical protein